MFARALTFLSLVGSLFAVSVQAEATVRVGPRYDFFHPYGYLHAVQGSGGGWVETLGGNEAFYFRQTDRNDTYVELYDSSRNLSVRLYGNAMYLKASGEPDFHFYYTGHWDDRRLYTYAPVAGQVAYLNLFTAEIWHWVRPGAQTLNMREILRNDDQVQVYNGAEGLTISLMDHQIWMKLDGHDWFKYADGAWN